MYFICLLLALVGAISPLSYNDLLKEEWQAYKLEHNKTYYDSAEEQTRLQIYLNNRHTIAKHNQLYASGLVSYEMGLNQYSDLTEKEFTDTMTGYIYSWEDRVDDISFITPANVNISNRVDWRNAGAVTAVKSQGRCRSSWAFSATGALEGQHFRKTRRLISLSEQNLIDCSKSNHGCRGGNVNLAFAYIRNNRGIDTERSYPYKARNGNCHFDRSRIGATLVHYVNIQRGSEEKLRQAVATIGPISIAIDATASFRHYRRGVYVETKCSTNHLNHALLVVGYGTDRRYGDYWLVKNSWSRRWGESGYIKIARNRHNQCGVATAASYPVV